MAFHNANFQSINLEGGNTYSTADLGNGITASTVHEVFCLTGGDITIQPLGNTSNKFTWTAVAGQSMSVVVGNCSVAGGALFVGFKAKHDARRFNQQGTNY